MDTPRAADAKHLRRKLFAAQVCLEKARFATL